MTATTENPKRRRHPKPKPDTMKRPIVVSPLKVRNEMHQEPLDTQRPFRDMAPINRSLTEH